MYQVNSLNVKCLITPREYIGQSPSTEVIDERMIWSNILIAERRFILPLLGYDFYTALVDSKNVVITSGNQAAMLTKVNDYLTSISGTTITSSDLPVGMMVNAAEEMTEANQTLWKDYLCKLAAEAVELVMIVPTWVQHTNQGQQKNNPEVIGGNGQGSASADLKEVKYKEDKFLQDRIDPLTAALKMFLCKNKTTYPLYTGACGENDTDGVSFHRKSPIIMGIYDDDETTCNE